MQRTEKSNSMSGLKRIFTLTILWITLVFQGFGQTGVIEGKVLNDANNESLPFANVLVWGTNIGASTDLNGNFVIKGVAPGYVKLAVSSVGYETFISEDIFVTRNKPSTIEIRLKETVLQIKEAQINASPYRKTPESPLSIRTIGLQEIEKNPGASRDISKVIQSFPGVVSSPVSRNDLIVRGGGASENRFFLEGIEIPNINHFSA
jgi:hypothetical protein